MRAKILAPLNSKNSRRSFAFDLHHPHILFALIVSEGDGEVIQECEHFGLVIA